MNKQKFLNKQRRRRKFHTRTKVRGTAEKPRMSVFRSHQHIACQLIDDQSHRTLVSASTRDGDLAASIAYGGNQKAAAAVGEAVARRALEAGIQQVRFDRGSYRYHGRLAALADAAREAGLTL